MTEVEEIKERMKAGAHPFFLRGLLDLYDKYPCQVRAWVQQAWNELAEEQEQGIRAVRSAKRRKLLGNAIEKGGRGQSPEPSGERKFPRHVVRGGR